MRLAPPVTACVAAAALLLTGGCGKDDAPASTSSPSATASQLLPSGDPSTSSASPAAGPELTGTGFTLHLPQGWSDITSDMKASEPRISVAGRSDAKGQDYTANLNVLTTDNRSVTGTPTRAQLNRLAISTRAEIAASAPETATLQLASMDGSPAVHQEGSATYGDTPYYLVQYVTVRDAKNYILTFSFPTGVDAAARDEVIDPVLASFTFT